MLYICFDIAEQHFWPVSPEMTVAGSRVSLSFLHYYLNIWIKCNSVSIPLSRVKSFTSRVAFKYANALGIELSSGKMRTSVPETDDDDASSMEHGSSPSSDDEEIDIEGRMIQLVVVQKPQAWDDFGKRVAEAKERERSASVRMPPKVIVDFGALSYLARPQSHKKSRDDKEEAIRRALSLGEEENIWCKRLTMTLRGVYLT